ncbi:uncharacterized protein LOC134697999 [Mytilus trossulus]|uniref:uncharacterized protein LOC134697999 n=1 Tax=Mytilus trossulus TaxID=6551 RepID=UPI003003EBE0
MDDQAPNIAIRRLVHIHTKKTVCKVLCHITLQRLKKEVNKLLRDEQAGFRQERSCIDQIATLRISIEQTIEWQTSLYLTFVDFERAFDSIDHQVLWNILRHYGIPEKKIISVIKQLYDGLTCQVSHAETLTDPFQEEESTSLRRVSAIEIGPPSCRFKIKLMVRKRRKSNSNLCRRKRSRIQPDVDQPTRSPTKSPSVIKLKP